MVLIKNASLSEITSVAITKNHRLGDLLNKSVSHSSRDWKSMIKASAGLVLRTQREGAGPVFSPWPVCR